MGTWKQNAPINFMKIKKLKTFLLIFTFFLLYDEKIMKCADIKFEKFIGVYEEGEKTSSEILYGNNLKERFDSSDNYIKLYRNCEYEFNNSPKTFKQLYK